MLWHAMLGAAGVGGWAESGVNPAEYSRMLMRVACAYIEGADVRAVSSVDSWQSTPCASLNSYDSMSISSIDGGSSSDGSSSGRDPAAAVAVVNPRLALDTAHKLTKLPGSATACVVQLCPDKRSLIAANLVSNECCQGPLSVSAFCMQNRKAAAVSDQPPVTNQERESETP